MSGTIKGITIRFEGDTTKLDKALRQVNNETRNIDKELKNVNKALKFNPTSVELWRQKQQLLTQKVDETSQKLSLLKQAQAQMDASGVNKNSEEYRQLQREIIETESKLETFKNQLKQVGNVRLKALSEQIGAVGTKLQDAGQKMAKFSAVGAAVSASIGALAYKAGVAADDLNTLSKVTGIGTDQLQLYGVSADLVDVSTEAIAKSNAKLKKSMLSASEGSGAMAEAFNTLGVSVTNSDGSLKDSNTVFQEVLGSLGSMENETERDALAMQLLGKSASELNPLIEDGGETYKNVAETLKKYDLEMVSEEDLNAANQFNDSLDTMKVLGTVAMQTVGTQLAAYLAPALETVVGWIGKLAQWLSTLSPQVLTAIAVVGGVVAAVAPVLIVLGKLATGISAIIKLANVLGIGIGALASPIGIAIAAIAAIIAIGVLLYKNWDEIKAYAKKLWTSIKTTFNGIKSSITTTINAVKSFLSSAWSAIWTRASSAFNSIKNAITQPIQTAKDTISGIIETIKGFFPISIGRLLSNISLPHFALDWATKDFGKLGSIKYPTGLDVSWYAHGGIFDSPSIIGVGEAGSEAVVPLDKLWKKLDAIAEGNSGIVININGAEASPREIAEEVRRELIRESNRRRLAWQ